MSLFGREFVRHALGPHCAIDDGGTDVAVQDGVTVRRRSVLWLSVGAVGALLGSGSSLRAQRRQDPAPAPADGGLTFEQLLTALLPEARRVVASKGADEEAYLMTVAAAVSRLRDPATPMREQMRAFRDANQDGGRLPIAVTWMHLEPGKGFEAHDHLNYDGVILGLGGEVRIRNFDFVGEPPAIESTETFRIRETRDDVILPGRISTLGTKRENVHELVAGPEGADVLDVFTFFEGAGGSRYLDVDKTPRDAERRLYDAAWRPRRRRG